MDVQLKILATIETLAEDRAREIEKKTGTALSEIEKEFRARVKARQEKMKKGISEQRFS
jgi:molybdopterin converting factor small subunit